MARILFDLEAVSILAFFILVFSVAASSQIPVNVAAVGPDVSAAAPAQPDTASSAGMSGEMMPKPSLSSSGASMEDVKQMIIDAERRYSTGFESLEGIGKKRVTVEIKLPGL